jgi:hypothetical protein
MRLGHWDSAKKGKYVRDRDKDGGPKKNRALRGFRFKDRTHIMYMC